METSESRRRAGALIADARQRSGLSQRELARRAGISETWLRAMTAGLRGEDPQRAADDTWVSLAKAAGADIAEVFTALERDVPAVGVDPLPEIGTRYIVEERTIQGAVGETVAYIVRDVEADTGDMSEEEAEATLQAVLDRIRSQAEVALEEERRRVERRRRLGESDDA